MEAQRLAAATVVGHVVQATVAGTGQPPFQQRGLWLQPLAPRRLCVDGVTAGHPRDEAHIAGPTYDEAVKVQLAVENLPRRPDGCPSRLTGCSIEIMVEADCGWR